MDPWYLKKNFKPSSLRKYPQTAQYTHPRPSNTPPKRTQMLLDSLYTRSRSNKDRLRNDAPGQLSKPVFIIERHSRSFNLYSQRSKDTNLSNRS